MNCCKSKKGYDCDPELMCPDGMTAYGRRSIGTYAIRFRVYENCTGDYEVQRICAYCGCEYNPEHDECPMCAAPADLGAMEVIDEERSASDNPDGNPDGFGLFGGFRRRPFLFSSFFRFLPFFPLFFRLRRRF